MRTLALAAGETVGALFPIVDPIGNAPTFAALTRGWSREERLREARRAAIVMALVLLAFVAAGEPLLHFFGVSLESLKVAGGLVIGYAGFQMVVAPPRTHVSTDEPRSTSIAFAPMAIPLLAGPGAMGVVMGFEARDAGALRFPGFVLGILAIAATGCVGLRGSDRIISTLGEAGSDALAGI